MSNSGERITSWFSKSISDKYKSKPLENGKEVKTTKDANSETTENTKKRLKTRERGFFTMDLSLKSSSDAKSGDLSGETSWLEKEIASAKDQEKYIQQQIEFYKKLMDSTDYVGLKSFSRDKLTSFQEQYEMCQKRRQNLEKYLTKELPPLPEKFEEQDPSSSTASEKSQVISSGYSAYSGSATNSKQIREVIYPKQVIQRPEIINNNNKNIVVPKASKFKEVFGDSENVVVEPSTSKFAHGQQIYQNSQFSQSDSDQIYVVSNETSQQQTSDNFLNSQDNSQQNGDGPQLTSPLAKLIAERAEIQKKIAEAEVNRYIVEENVNKQKKQTKTAIDNMHSISKEYKGLHTNKYERGVERWKYFYNANISNRQAFAFNRERNHYESLGKKLHQKYQKLSTQIDEMSFSSLGSEKGYQPIDLSQLDETQSLEKATKRLLDQYNNQVDGQKKELVQEIGLTVQNQFYISKRKDTVERNLQDVQQKIKDVQGKIKKLDADQTQKAKAKDRKDFNKELKGYKTEEALLENQLRQLEGKHRKFSMGIENKNPIFTKIADKKWFLGTEMGLYLQKLDNTNRRSDRQLSLATTRGIEIVSLDAGWYKQRQNDLSAHPEKQTKVEQQYRERVYDLSVQASYDMNKFVLKEGKWRDKIEKMHTERLILQHERDHVGKQISRTNYYINEHEYTKGCLESMLPNAANSTAKTEIRKQINSLGKDIETFKKKENELQNEWLRLKLKQTGLSQEIRRYQWKLGALQKSMQTLDQVRSEASDKLKSGATEDKEQNATFPRYEPKKLYLPTHEDLKSLSDTLSPKISENNIITSTDDDDEILSVHDENNDSNKGVEMNFATRFFQDGQWEERTKERQQQVEAWENDIEKLEAERKKKMKALKKSINEYHDQLNKEIKNETKTWQAKAKLDLAQKYQDLSKGEHSQEQSDLQEKIDQLSQEVETLDSSSENLKSQEVGKWMEKLLSSQETKKGKAGDKAPKISRPVLLSIYESSATAEGRTQLWENVKNTSKNIWSAMTPKQNNETTTPDSQNNRIKKTWQQIKETWNNSHVTKNACNAISQWATNLDIKGKFNSGTKFFKSNTESTPREVTRANDGSAEPKLIYNKLTIELKNAGIDIAKDMNGQFEARLKEIENWDKQISRDSQKSRELKKNDEWKQLKEDLFDKIQKSAETNDASHRGNVYNHLDKIFCPQFKQLVEKSTGKQTLTQDTSGTLGERESWPYDDSAEIYIHTETTSSSETIETRSLEKKKLPEIPLVEQLQQNIRNISADICNLYERSSTAIKKEIDTKIGSDIHRANLNTKNYYSNDNSNDFEITLGIAPSKEKLQGKMDQAIEHKYDLMQANLRELEKKNPSSSGVQEFVALDKEAWDLRDQHKATLPPEWHNWFVPQHDQAVWNVVIEHQNNPLLTKDIIDTEDIQSDVNAMKYAINELKTYLGYQVENRNTDIHNKISNSKNDENRTNKEITNNGDNKSEVYSDHTRNTSQVSVASSEHKAGDPDDESNKSYTTARDRSNSSPFYNPDELLPLTPSDHQSKVYIEMSQNNSSESIKENNWSSNNGVLNSSNEFRSQNNKKLNYSNTVKENTRNSIVEHILEVEDPIKIQEYFTNIEQTTNNTAEQTINNAFRDFDSLYQKSSENIRNLIDYEEVKEFSAKFLTDQHPKVDVQNGAGNIARTTDALIQANINEFRKMNKDNEEVKKLCDLDTQFFDLYVNRDKPSEDLKQLIETRYAPLRKEIAMIHLEYEAQKETSPVEAKANMDKSLKEVTESFLRIVDEATQIFPTAQDVFYGKIEKVLDSFAPDNKRIQRAIAAENRLKQQEEHKNETIETDQLFANDQIEKKQAAMQQTSQFKQYKSFFDQYIVNNNENLSEEAIVEKRKELASSLKKMSDILKNYNSVEEVTSEVGEIISLAEMQNIYNESNTSFENFREVSELKIKKYYLDQYKMAQDNLENLDDLQKTIDFHKKLGKDKKDDLSILKMSAAIQNGSLERHHSEMVEAVKWIKDLNPNAQEQQNLKQMEEECAKWKNSLEGTKVIQEQVETYLNSLKEKPEKMLKSVNSKLEALCNIITKFPQIKEGANKADSVQLASMQEELAEFSKTLEGIIDKGVKCSSTFFERAQNRINKAKDYKRILMQFDETILDEDKNEKLQVFDNARRDLYDKQDVVGKYRDLQELKNEVDGLLNDLAKVKEGKIKESNEIKKTLEKFSEELNCIMNKQRENFNKSGQTEINTTNGPRIGNLEEGIITEITKIGITINQIKEFSLGFNDKYRVEEEEKSVKELIEHVSSKLKDESGNFPGALRTFYSAPVNGTEAVVNVLDEINQDMERFLEAVKEAAE